MVRGALCIYVCRRYEYIYIYIYIYLYIYICIYMYVCMYIHTCKHTCINIYIGIRASGGGGGVVPPRKVGEDAVELAGDIDALALVLNTVRVIEPLIEPFIAP